MWHVTCDMWHVTHRGRWTFSQNFRSLAHTVREWRCLEDLEEKGSLSKWVNDKGVCRTAPATPGLLITDLAFLYEIYPFFLLQTEINQTKYVDTMYKMSFNEWHLIDGIFDLFICLILKQKPNQKIQHTGSQLTSQKVRIIA